MAKQNKDRSYTTKVTKIEKPTPKGGQVPTSRNPTAPKPKK